MKYKSIFILTFIFFLIVNTHYFWEYKLDHFAILFFFLLIVFYIVLFIVFLRHLYLAIKERFADKQRLLLIVVFITVLSLSFLRPAGIIDFNELENPGILIAQMEGAANCWTTFKLTKNNTFTEKTECFGGSEITGEYKLVNDTIYFENVKPDRKGNGFYKFAVVHPSKFFTGNKHFDLVRYRDINDTTGNRLLITRNKIEKITNAKAAH